MIHYLITIDEAAPNSLEFVKTLAEKAEDYSRLLRGQFYAVLPAGTMCDLKFQFPSVILGMEPV